MPKIEWDPEIRNLQIKLQNPNFCLWVAGYFEIAGFIGCFISNGHARLIISVSDQHDYIQLLKEQLGGNNNRKSDYSHNLVIYKSAMVIAIAKATKDYSPSRRDVLGLIENWQNLEIFERLQLANKIKGQTAIISGSTQEYQELVNQPAFVAGIIDARSKLNPDQLRVGTSQNKSLLEAIASKYGGKVYEWFTEGDTAQFPQGETVLDNSTYYLFLGKKNAKRLVTDISAHIRIRRNETDQG